MTWLTASALSAMAVLAPVQSEPPSNLDLWACSYLSILHGHPTGREGRLIEMAERKLGDRKAKLYDWMIKNETKERLDTLDQEMSDPHGIFFTRGPTIEEEWASYKRAERCVYRLEKRYKEELRKLKRVK